MTNLQIALIKYREEHKLSQTQLAEKIGCTRNALANWETGRSTPKADVYKLISEKLNCSLSYLLDENSQQTKFSKETIVPTTNNSNPTLIALHDQAEALSDEQLKQVISYVKFLKSQENKA